MASIHFLYYLILNGIFPSFCFIKTLSFGFTVSKKGKIKSMHLNFQFISSIKYSSSVLFSSSVQSNKQVEQTFSSHCQRKICEPWMNTSVSSLPSVLSLHRRICHWDHSCFYNSFLTLYAYTFRVISGPTYEKWVSN